MMVHPTGTLPPSLATIHGYFPIGILISSILPIDGNRLYYNTIGSNRQ